MIEIQLEYLLFAIETILVVSGIAIFYYFRSKKTDVKVTVKKIEGNTFHQGVTAELAKAKLNLDRAMVSSGESKADEDKVKSMRARIAWLEMESEAANQKIESGKFWNDNYSRVVDMLNKFGLLEVTKVEQKLEVAIEDGAGDESGEESLAEILEKKDQEDNIKLRRQVAFLEERVTNLGKFRDLFFDLKQQMDEMKKANRNLKASLLAAMSDGDHVSLDIPRYIEEHDEAERMVEQELHSVETQRRHLHDKLSAAEENHRKDVRKLNTEWQNTVARTRDKEREKSVKEMSSLKQLAGDQTRQIMALNDSLKKMEQGGETDSFALKKQLEAVQTSTKDMETCMNVLEMENDRLQESLDREIEKVRELEDQHKVREQVVAAGGGVQVEEGEQVAHLQEVVSGLEQSMEDLKSKISELAPEADKAKELEEVVGGIEEKNMQLINSNQRLITDVSSLKNEKADLLKKMEALAEASNQLDAGSSDEAAALQAQLKSQLEELEATNVEKQIQVEELGAKYEALEKEYLSLYDQMQQS